MSSLENVGNFSTSMRGKILENSSQKKFFTFIANDDSNGVFHSASGIIKRMREIMALKNIEIKAWTRARAWWNKPTVTTRWKEKQRRLLHNVKKKAFKSSLDRCAPFNKTVSSLFVDVAKLWTIERRARNWI